MAEAMDLNLFLNSFSEDIDNSVEPAFIPDYRNFSFTKSELHLLYDEVIDELFKENQVDWEADIPLNMGQWLSIPMIILGLIIFIKTFPSKK